MLDSFSAWLWGAESRTLWAFLRSPIARSGVRAVRATARGVLDLGKRIYVGNIPFSLTEDELREAFGQHGSVTSVDVITDRETGRPRGFAFVEMEESSAADAAVEALDGKDFGGRNLRVNEALERGGGGQGRR